GAPRRRRPERRLGGALLLRAGARAAGRPRAPPALRLARRLRGAAGEARPARPRARRPLPRALDANDHVDREAAARSGVGFYGKNTLLITRRHGSWVVLGTLVTAAALEPTPPLAADCGSCRLCVDACPTSAARSTPPAASRSGRRSRSRSRPPTARRSARRCTAATSARTSAPGTAGSSAGARPNRPTPARMS